MRYVLLVFVMLFSGCGRKPARNAAKPPCRLTKAQRSALAAVLKPGSKRGTKPEKLRRAQRLKLLQRVTEACGLPRVARRVMENPNEDYPRSYAPYQVPQDLMPRGWGGKFTRDHLMWWTGRACPVLTKDDYGSYPPDERASRVYQGCFRKLKLFSWAEFRHRPRKGIIALMLYQVLQRRGLPTWIARGAARAWMGPDPYLELEDIGIRVPHTTSHTAARISRPLFLARNRVSRARIPQKVQWAPFSAKVLESALRGDPTFREKGSSVAVFVDAATRYDVLHKTLRAISRASGRDEPVQLIGHLGYDQLSSILVRSEDRMPPVAIQKQLPAPKDLPLSLSLIVRAQDCELRSKNGSECPEDMDQTPRYCFRSHTRGGVTAPAALRELQRHLWYLYAAKYKSCVHHGNAKVCDAARHTLYISAPPTLLFSDLVKLLDAVRLGPKRLKDPLNPPRPQIPTSGC